MKYRKIMKQQKDEMDSLVLELIKIPTENPPGRLCRDCVDLLDAKLRGFGWHTEIHTVEATEICAFPRHILIARWGEGVKKLFFHGHYDVIPAACRSQFDPYIKGNRLVGRGSADMKGGLVSMIYAVRTLQVAGEKINGQIQLNFVPDEETGGKYGTGYLLRKGLIKRKDAVAMFMPEPTSGTVWNGSRGAISMMLTIRGKPVHATLQHRGINAFEKMLAVAAQLQKLKRKVELKKTSCRVAAGQRSNSILMLGGICEGGTNFNVVPGRISFSVDRRLNPEEDLKKEKKTLFAVLRGMKRNGIQMEVKMLQEGVSTAAAVDSMAARALAASIEDIIGRCAQFCICPGLLETRYFIKLGIPAYAYGPGMLSEAHGPVESVDLQNTYDCAVIYALTAQRFLGHVQ